MIPLQCNESVVVIEDDSSFDTPDDVSLMQPLKRETLEGDSSKSTLTVTSFGIQRG